MKILALLLALLFVPASVTAQSSPPDQLKLLVNPQLIFDLPLMIGIERGFFKDQNLDIKVITHSGSSQTIIPSIVRGDVDIAEISPSPGFFNQSAQGFDAKIIGSTMAGHKGWGPAMWLVVRQDEWDNKTIRVPHDLRGKKIDATLPGGEGWYLTLQVMTQGALTRSDLTFSQRFATPSDWLASLRNVNDVQAAFEPTVTQLEQQHIGHRWISVTDIDPSYQEGYLAASGKALKARPDVFRRFLVGYIKASKVIADGKGRWTPEILGAFAKYSGLDPSIIAKIPTPPYTGEYGNIHTAFLEKIQRFWHTNGLLESEAPIDTLVDGSFIAAAQRSAGVKAP